MCKYVCVVNCTRGHGKTGDWLITMNNIRTTRVNSPLVRDSAHPETLLLVYCCSYNITHLYSLIFMTAAFPRNSGSSEKLQRPQSTPTVCHHTLPSCCQGTLPIIFPQMSVYHHPHLISCWEGSVLGLD